MSQINNGSQASVHKKKMRLSDQNENDGYSSEVVNEPIKTHPIPKNVRKITISLKIPRNVIPLRVHFIFSWKIN